jgi:GNAT superfamily N-acetyltransferase
MTENGVDTLPKGASIQPAWPQEENELSDLAFRSKASWGYNSEILNDWKEFLTVKKAKIEQGWVFVLRVENKVHGFYVFNPEKQEPHLSFLFIDPGSFRRGYGKALFKNAVQFAHSKGWSSFLICSDPPAQGFYERMGAVPMGFFPSPSIQEGFLPVLRMWVGFSMSGGAKL